MMLSTRAKRAPEPNGHEEVVPNSQIPPPHRGFGSMPATLAWGSGVHRKLKGWRGRGEVERMLAIERSEQFKAYSPGKDQFFSLLSDL